MWGRCGSRFAISEDGLVATFGTPVGNGPGHELSQYDFSAQLVTCEQLMTEGRHYWEVALTRMISSTGAVGSVEVYVGAVPAGVTGQDCDDRDRIDASSAVFTICSDPDNDSVSLFGSGKSEDAGEAGCDGDVSHVDQGEQFVFRQGDRIGMLLDLDAGSLRFYRNGVRLRQEFASGVTGPLLRSVEVRDEGAAVTALPGAEPPADDACD